MSYIAKSNVICDIMIVLSLDLAFIFSLTAKIVFITDECCIATPLGVPVVPEVYII